ncbi:MAG: 7-carboxy-7-deazaguanine synthase QueE, partial [Planctomycetota bacterium]|nr:7-carboxy-7-deazaguanine synthase QueE [Planctomycetota bacterium]
MPQPVLVHLDEIFYSLQGEAGEIGRPHLFLRLGGCPLRCVYCDTPRSWSRRAEYERHLGRATTRHSNPLDADALDAELAVVCAHHGVEASDTMLAVTGGEPLEQVEFLQSWLPRWPGRALLETAGVWPDRLRA